MRLILFIPIFALLGFLTAIPETDPSTDEGEWTSWSESRKLTWDDFQGKPNNNSHLAAETMSRINFGYECDGKGNFSYTAEAVFNKQLSWVKEKRTERLLRHEQVHFDITELHARKLKKIMTNLNDPCVHDVEVIEGLVLKIFDDWEAMQNDYDAETNHGLEHERQAEWEHKVMEELKQLSAFK